MTLSFILLPHVVLPGIDEMLSIALGCRRVRTLSSCTKSLYLPQRATRSGQDAIPQISYFMVCLCALHREHSEVRLLD